MLSNRDLLDIPQSARSFVEDVVGFGMNRMNQTTGLTAPETRLRPAEEFSAVPVELIQFPVSVTAVNIF